MNKEISPNFVIPLLVELVLQIGLCQISFQLSTGFPIDLGLPCFPEISPKPIIFPQIGGKYIKNSGSLINFTHFEILLKYFT